jgi:four helix bundle protein
MPTDAPSAPADAPARLAPPPAYRGLRVWQRALDLVVDAAPLARTLAAEGHGGLAGDLFRAGTAVPAHIAAGSVAASRGEYQHALAAALASAARFETLVAAAERLAPNAADACAALLAGSADVTRSLRAFARVIAGGRPRAPEPGDAADRAPVRSAADGVVADPQLGDGVAPLVPASGLASGSIEEPVLELIENAAEAPVEGTARGGPPAAGTGGVPAPMPVRPARARRVRSG